MEQSFYEAFSIETAARLRAHDQAMAAHEERMQAHDETIQEMRAAHAVWLRTQERHSASFQAIMDRLAAGMIDHETRISDHTRAMQEITATLQAIRNSL